MKRAASDGRDPWCRECHKAHRPYDPVKAKEHRVKARPRRAALEPDRNRKRLYGLEPGEYDRMVVEQGGRCAVCGDEAKLFVDHCHATSKVRGLLCRLCNLMLGHARDDVAVLEKAVAYLKEQG